jgi:hypothetical protein
MSITLALYIFLFFLMSTWIALTIFLSLKKLDEPRDIACHVYDGWT